MFHRFTLQMTILSVDRGPVRFFFRKLEDLDWKIRKSCAKSLCDPVRQRIFKLHADPVLVFIVTMFQIKGNTLMVENVAGTKCRENVEV